MISSHASPCQPRFRCTLAKSILATTVFGLVGVAATNGAASAAIPTNCVLGQNNVWGALTGGGISPAAGLPNSVGTTTAVMLFVDFPNAPAGAETTQSAYDLHVPTAKGLLDELSDHRFDLTVDTMSDAPWMRMPHTSTFYGFSDGVTGAEQIAYMTDAVNIAAFTGFDFHGYDEVFVVSSRSAGGAFPSTEAYRRGSASTIIAPGGVVIRAGATFGRTHNDRPNQAAWGLAHETMHTLGLPDLYKVPVSDPYEENFKYAGPWDLMSTTRSDSHLTTWQKAHLGWIDTDQIACVNAASSTFVLTPSELSGGLKAVVIKTGPTTAIVAENRQLIGADADQCDHGLLVYKVNSAATTGTGPLRVFPSEPENTVSPNWAQCGKLWNAPFDKRPGKNATFTSFTSGVTIAVTDSTNGGNLSVRVTLNPNLVLGIPIEANGTDPTDPIPPFISLDPARLVDTRPGQTTIDGAHSGSGRLTAGSTLAVAVAGRGAVAASAAAVALNVTVADPSSTGYLTVYPCDSPRPTASNLNYVVHGTIPNAVVTKLAADGTICLFTQSELDVIVDVDGYFPATTTYHPLAPARLLETRIGGTTIDGVQQGTGAAEANSVTVVHTAGRGGIPADASAAVLNVTITEPAAPGYATVYPCGTEPPTASSLNYTAGLTTPNLVIAKTGTNGDVCIYTQSVAHIVVDTDGYFPHVDPYIAITPGRVVDTRVGGTTIDGQSSGARIRPAGSITVVPVTLRAGLPIEASTAVLNVTVTEPAAAGYLTIYPCGIEPPHASNLNYTAGQTIPNAVITRISGTGDICIYNSERTQLIVDITGYYP